MRAKAPTSAMRRFSTAARGFEGFWRKCYHISLSQTPFNGPLTFPGVTYREGRRQKKTGEVLL